MDRKKPLVTVGITTYNDEKTIESCIQSILAQTLQNFELVIINDGSREETKHILDKYINHPKIRIINSNQNLGTPYRHNQLAQEAKGNYLAKIDADDYMVANRLELQVSHLEKSDRIEVVSGWAYSINEAGVIINSKKYKSKITPFNLLFKNTIIHSTVMARTSWFLKNKYDESLLRCQDVDLWVRSVSSENYSLIEEFLVYYREPTDNAKLMNSRKFMFSVINKNRSSLNLFEYVLLNFVYIVKYLITYLFLPKHG